MAATIDVTSNGTWDERRIGQFSANTQKRALAEARHVEDFHAHSAVPALFVSASGWCFADQVPKQTTLRTGDDE